jgi:hypothetical protein
MFHCLHNSTKSRDFNIYNNNNIIIIYAFRGPGLMEPVDIGKKTPFLAPSWADNIPDINYIVDTNYIKYMILIKYYIHKINQYGNSIPEIPFLKFRSGNSWNHSGGIQIHLNSAGME